jgi:hypothetical protein
MADPKEKLKKTIGDLKAQLAKEKAAGKDLKKDSACRQLRKTLKRAQRKLKALSPLGFDEKVALVGKLTELLNKRMGELVPTGAKKLEGNPYIHSLRKKLKSLNKRKKKLDRIAKKKAAKAASAPSPGGAAADKPEAAASPPAEEKK